MSNGVGFFAFKQGREGIKLTNMSAEVVNEWYFLPYCIPVTLKHLTQCINIFFFYYSLNLHSRLMFTLRTFSMEEHVFF